MVLFSFATPIFKYTLVPQSPDDLDILRRRESGVIELC